MSQKFSYESLNLTQKNLLVYTSYSKRNFFLRSEISAFVLKKKETPISPFMNFDYNLANLVDQNLIRIANNSLVKICDELWVFGEISDGVLAEIYLAKKFKKPTKYFIYNEDKRTFCEIIEGAVRLDDVSPWLWRWLKNGKNLERWHPRLRFNKTYPVIYPAYSKRNFFWQMHISQFCLEKKRIPLNPFMLFRYFLGDAVPRQTVYLANNNIVRICKELWVFGDIADGVLAEIKLKKDKGEIVKYFKIAQTNPVVFRRIQPKSAIFEKPDLEQFRHLL
jgi:hypothetical protein